MDIRSYHPDDETGWVRCRTLSFLDTAYYDDVLNKKEKYDNPAIELVAVKDDQIVGLLDIECEEKAKTVCTKGKGLGGMIWHIATHPDYQRQGIATKLLQRGEELAKNRGLDYLEAWTRDDKWVNKWYEKSGFKSVYSYLHVFLEGEKEMREVAKLDNPNFQVMQAFAHYTGGNKDRVKKNFKRVHECFCFEKAL